MRRMQLGHERFGSVGPCSGERVAVQLVAGEAELVELRGSDQRGAAGAMDDSGRSLFVEFDFLPEAVEAMKALSASAQSTIIPRIDLRLLMLFPLVPVRLLSRRLSAEGVEIAMYPNSRSSFL